MLALIGKLFNVALGWALPGLSAIWLYLAAGLLAVAVPSIWAYHVGSEGKAAALARCEAACTLTMSELKTDAERAISDILSTVGESGDFSENVAQYCKRNPGLCRTEGGE
jgi:hypothetical protein